MQRGKELKYISGKVCYQQLDSQWDKMVQIRGRNLGSEAGRN